MKSECAAMVGAVVSCTVTRNAALLVWPLESLAEQLTVLVPNPKLVPELGAQLTATGPSTRSKAEAEKLTGAPAGPVASAVIFAGRVMIGPLGS